MGLSQAISEARRTAAQKQERALREHFRQHGVPDQGDLSRVLIVKSMFPNADFEKVLTEVKSGRNSE